MSLTVRLALLLGCGLVATLEAPEAGTSLSEGLAGPYAPHVRLDVAPLARRAAVLPFGLPLEPVVFTLATVPLPLGPTLAVGR